MEDEMMEFEEEMYSEEIQSQIKDKLARRNYDVVVSGDISFEDFYGEDNQKDIEKTLNDMIEHFTEFEEYEKCAKILKALKLVEGNLTIV
jgi:hypothetical protein